MSLTLENFSLAGIAYIPSNEASFQAVLDKLKPLLSKKRALIYQSLWDMYSPLIERICQCVIPIRIANAASLSENPSARPILPRLAIMDMSEKNPIPLDSMPTVNQKKDLNHLLNIRGLTNVLLA